MQKEKISKLKLLLKNRKVIIIASCIVLICMAVYVDYRTGLDFSNNYIYTSEIADSAKILGEAKFVDSLTELGEAESDSYFANAALERKRARDEAVEMLQNVIDSSESLTDAKEEALGAMMAIAGNISTEASIESLIKAKGYEDCIAVMNSDGINIIVKSSGLLTNEVAQITEIVMNESGFTPEDITLVEKN